MSRRPFLYLMRLLRLAVAAQPRYKASMATTTTLDPETAAAIRDAMTAATSGRIADARRIGEDALATGGDAVALNAMLGTFCLGAGDFEAAVHHLRVARDQRPQDVIIALNLGTALVQLSRFKEALDIVPEALAAVRRQLSASASPRVRRAIA